MYYIALWLDPNGSLTESNEINNASLSWGTIQVGGWSVSAGTRTPSDPDGAEMVPGQAYNGKTLPTRQELVRQVRLSRTPGEGAGAGQGVKAAEAQRWSKVARARQQVVFPVAEMKAMPGGD